MSWGHAVLELDEDADPRAVKRAYAKRLRTTRPDDDPAGFQQLHEAYQAALDWATHRQQWQQEPDDGEDPPLEQACAAAAREDNTPVATELDTVADAAPVAQDPVQTVASGDTTYAGAPQRAPTAPPSTPIPPPLPPPLPRPPGVPLDPAVFAQRVIGEACQSEPASFERWLQLRPELWSLRDKPDIGAAVLEHLLCNNAPLCADNFDLLVQCFGWDDVDSGLDPYDAAECRLRLHRLWVLQPRNQAGLARYLDREQDRVDHAEAQTRLQRLTRPWQPLRAVWDAWRPRHVQAIRDTLAMLGVHDAGDVAPPLQPAQVTFWLAVADRQQLSWPRLQVALLRTLMCALAVLAVALLLALGANVSGNAAASARLFGSSFYAAASVLAVGTLWPLLRAFFQWQVADEDVPVRWRLLRLWLIPIMAVGALLLIHPADARLAGSALAWFTLGLAVRRWWQRGGYVFQFNGWLLLAVVPFLKLGGLALLFGEVAVAGALLAWTVDAMTQVVHRR